MANFQWNPVKWLSLVLGVWVCVIGFIIMFIQECDKKIFFPVNCVLFGLQVTILHSWFLIPCTRAKSLVDNTKENKKQSAASLFRDVKVYCQMASIFSTFEFFALFHIIFTKQRPVATLDCFTKVHASKFPKLQSLFINHGFHFLLGRYLQSQFYTETSKLFVTWHIMHICFSQIVLRKMWFPRVWKSASFPFWINIFQFLLRQKIWMREAKYFGIDNHKKVYLNYGNSRVTNRR